MLGMRLKITLGRLINTTGNIKKQESGFFESVNVLFSSSRPISGGI